MAYSIIEGRFYYGNTDGDYFDFEGFIKDIWGAGSFVAGETIRPGNSKGWEFDFRSLPNSYVKIENADNYPGSIYDHPSYEFTDLFITSYFDADSGRTVVPLRDSYGDNGSYFNNFSGELFVDGIAYKFDSETSVDLALLEAVPTPTPEPTPETTTENTHEWGKH